MLGRILALIVKELMGLWKDRKTRFVILIPPLVQVLVFAYAATYDVKNVPLGIWNEDGGAQAAELVRRFAGSPAFLPAALIESPAEARRALDSRRVAAVLHIPERFSADILARRPAAVQLLIDGRRSNTALLVNGYATTILADAAENLGVAQTPPIVLQVRDWFNPTLESQWFILPGLVAVLSLLMAMLVSALSLARERELGTFEQLLVTPLQPFEILVGKAVPGMVVGFINANIVVLAALFWFRVPLQGSLPLLESMLLLYMVTGGAIGLVISSLTATQQQAMLGVFVIASPMVVLSGYAAPVANMPAAAEIVGRLDPIRWMLVITRGIFLQDMAPALVLQTAVPIALVGFLVFLLAWVAVRRALR
jgi:ABC-2 type transport system permease protein